MMGTLTVQQDAFLTALSQQRDGLAQEEMFHQEVLAKHQELMLQLLKSQILQQLFKSFQMLDQCHKWGLLPLWLLIQMSF